MPDLITVIAAGVGCRNHAGPDYRHSHRIGVPGPLLRMVTAGLVNLIVKRDQREYQGLIIDAAAGQFSGGKHADSAALTFYILYSG